LQAGEHDEVWGGRLAGGFRLWNYPGTVGTA